MSKVTYDFSGENYVVTGASSGMGKQVALDLAAAGANVLAIARNEERLASLKAVFPNNIHCRSIDVCEYRQIEDIINEYVTEYGKVNGLVHAAGINIFTPIKTFSMEDAAKIMDISFWAGINLVKILVQNKYCFPGSSYVLFSSLCAASHEKGMFAYAGAKAAINSSVGVIAKEISKRRHRINTVMPGWVGGSEMTTEFENEINPSELKTKHFLGLGEPNDVSGAVLFLLSDSAKWITGTNLVVDGGALA